jgi:ABC-2 type transport system ATP-binding protein
MRDSTLLLLLVPLVLVQIALVVAALWDLTRPGRRVRGNSRVLWALVILFVSTIGPILYFVIGREEAGPTATDAPRPAAPDAVAGWVPAARSEPSATSPSPGVSLPEPAPAASLAAPTAPTGSPAVRCEGLTKRYGSGAASVLALDRLDLEVPTGSVFGLLGPNGAGKTTTLRILAGLGHATDGRATVAGADVDGSATDLTRHIGYLDQDPTYYGWLTGRELVDLVARLHDVQAGERAARTAEVLERVGLADAADRRISTYSGGMRQRLGIAQALVNRPPLLILDEPVSSLDPEGRRDLLALIADLRGSATVLFSTHVLDDVERICDRIAILHRGRLVTEGPLAELLDRYALPVYRLDPEPGQEAAIARLAASLRASDWVTDVSIAHGAVAVSVSDPDSAARELLPAVVAAGVSLAGFERARPTLEDVFLRLVGRGSGEAAA